MRVGVFTLILELIFPLFTKVDDWVGFSSQSWLSPVLFGRLEESCPLFFVHWVFLDRTYLDLLFIEKSIFLFYWQKKKIFSNFVKVKEKNIHFKTEVVKVEDLLLAAQNKTLKISGQSFCS